MKREIIKDLLKWKESSNRKPLIVHGARQVGKTYIIKQFDLSFIFPIITGITQILVILAGVFLFKESMSTFSIVGVFLIIAGVTFLNIK